MTGTAVQQPRRAMAAHVEECLNAEIRSPHSHQRLAQEIKRVVVPWIRYVAEMAYHLPGSRKYALLFGFKKIRIAVDPAGQAEPLQTGGNLCGQVVVQRAFRFHDSPALLKSC
jgi:hypothetical protein